MKRFKLIDGTSAHTATFDWDACIFCQASDRSEPLQCPALSKRTDAGAGYQSVASNITGFAELGELPGFIRLSALDEGQGTAATLAEHNAKWHKSCRDKFNSTKLKRAEKRKRVTPRASDDCGDDTESSVAASSQQLVYCTEHFTRSSTSTCNPCANMPSVCCFLCDKSDGTLHNVTTFEFDARVRSFAYTLQDSKLIAKLSGGDMIATEAKYHDTCMLTLFNRVKAVEKSCVTGASDQSVHNHSLAFAQLVEYINEHKRDSSTKPLFKLADLVQKYTLRVQQLGENVECRINSTRLKERLLAHIPGLKAETEGKTVWLVFDKDIGTALSAACQFDADLEALHLSNAAHIVRRDLFNFVDTGTSSAFSGMFAKDCQVNSVPQSLLALIHMILDGPSIDDQSSAVVMPAARSIAQLTVFNAVKHARKPNDGPVKIRHNVSQETPLPLYLAMKVHAETRNRALIEHMFSLGLCVSYDRFLQVSAGLGNRISEHFDFGSGVSVPGLKKDAFTTAAVDNIDHNPSSATANDAFHGTAITLTQHRVSEAAHKAEMECVQQLEMHSKSMKPLPSSYTTVPRVMSLPKMVCVPKCSVSLPELSTGVNNAINDQYNWLLTVEKTVAFTGCNSVDLTEDVAADNCVNWSAYHSRQNISSDKATDVTTLLPLFRDAAHSPAMLCHALTIIQKAVRSVNSAQIPVVTLDQPLYAIAKQIQWCWSDTFGEQNFVLMLGGLHTEMAFMRTIGDWLDGSGWTSVLVNADVTSCGKADAMLHAAHVTRTRHAHQVTAVCLYILQRRAYDLYVASQSNESDCPDFMTWCLNKANTCPQFQYWSITLKLELLLLNFVRAIRQSDFDLYVESLIELAPWFFALDHQNYARWICVHVRDMLSLSVCHPHIHQEFVSGKFTVRKTSRAFSAIALDHAHEQMNASVKGTAGAIGLTERSNALLRWMVSGPEIARVLAEFELASGNDVDPDVLHHHELNQSHERRFVKHVTSLVAAFEELGNPFLEDSIKLFAIDTKNVASEDVIKTVETIEQLGKLQFNTYFQERLIDCTQALTVKIHRNKLPLFRKSSAVTKPVAKIKLASALQDSRLFSQLFVAGQKRKTDLDTFFEHETNPYSPSLSNGGEIRFGVKSDLLTCLESLVSSQPTPPAIDVLVVDGAAAVQMLTPKDCWTFADYAQKVFIPFVLSRLKAVKRVDVVWDQYFPDSLKSAARVKRGSGIKRRVMASAVLPSNWSAFLHVDDNKSELFHFLATELASVPVPADTLLVVTNGQDAICNPHESSNIDELRPCSHEEADTRMFLHAAQAAKLGYRNVLIRTVDTDVVVLAVALQQKVQYAELWIEFVSGGKVRYIHASAIASVLGSLRAQALPFFHAFTGCDTVSSFAYHGKKSAWETWNSFADATVAFAELSCQPHISTVLDCLPVVEQFVVLMYDRKSNCKRVNEARQQLFGRKSGRFESLPPTQAALIEHMKRAAFQSGHCWHQSLQAQQNLPAASDWGWRKVLNTWQPVWTTLPPVGEIASQLVSCKCVKGCTKHCKCFQAKLACTALCLCNSMCANSTQN